MVAAFLTLLTFSAGALPFERPPAEELGRIFQAHRVRRSAPFVELEPGDPHYVLVAGWGEKPTGGYSLRIERVRLRKNRLTVQVRTQAPAAQAIVTQALTYPTDAVWLPAKRLARGREAPSHRQRALPAVEMVDQEGKVLAGSASY